MPIVAKGHARACLIRKCFLSRDTSTLVHAFTTYVRPLLEHFSNVWSRHLKRDINKVESAQCKIHQNIWNAYQILLYTKRLAVLQLENIELRRLRFDPILTYKILLDCINRPTNQSLFLLSRQVMLLVAMHTKYRYCRVDVRKYFFAPRLIGPWNSLPATWELQEP